MAPVLASGFTPHPSTVGILGIRLISSSAQTPHSLATTSNNASSQITWNQISEGAFSSRVFSFFFFLFNLFFSFFLPGIQIPSPIDNPLAAAGSLGLTAIMNHRWDLHKPGHVPYSNDSAFQWSCKLFMPATQDVHLPRTIKQARSRLQSAVGR